MPAQTIAQLFDLTGKAAIVTGGATGIGQAIAFRLAEAGAAVLIADIDLEAANQTAEQIRARGSRAETLHADVSNVADAPRVVRATVDAFGTLDILVNNAGIYPFSPALQITEELWDRVLGINLKGMFFFSQAAARQMIRDGHGGKIINLASIDSLRPTGNLAHYDAAKGGVVMLTRALALELAPYQIRVNAIAPGGIQTAGAMAQQAAVLGATNVTIPELTQGFVARVPLGRVGEPDDVARVALFLASAAADYMTGSLIVVDGGYLLT